MPRERKHETSGRPCKLNFHVEKLLAVPLPEGIWDWLQKKAKKSTAQDYTPNDLVRDLLFEVMARDALQETMPQAAQHFSALPQKPREVKIVKHVRLRKAKKTPASYIEYKTESGRVVKQRVTQQFIDDLEAAERAEKADTTDDAAKKKFAESLAMIDNLPPLPDL